MEAIMPKACSRDLRERVVRRAGSCGSKRAAALQFGVSASSAIKWMQDFRRDGRLEARSQVGRQRSPLWAHRDFLLACIEQQPDLTLEAVQLKLAERGVEIHTSSISRFYTREGISFKKKPARQRAGQARRRTPPHPVEEISGQN